MPDIEEDANEVNELVHGKRMAAEDRHATKLSHLKLRSTDATGSPPLTAAVRMKVILWIETGQKFRYRATTVGASRLDQPRVQT
jgi:hypothetical protein